MMIFSEESSRVIYDMGNVEAEGLEFCGCGVCLRPDEDTINIILVKFQALVSSYYVARICSRGKKHGEAQWH